MKHGTVTRTVGLRPAAAAAAAFTMVELLVVVGIIAVLIGLFVPALSRARSRANQVVCQSNLRQIGAALLMYANHSRGWLYPVGPPVKGPDGKERPSTLGSQLPRAQRWPVYALDPPVWNPPIMLCPGDFEPEEQHSYVLNKHLSDHRITYASNRLGGLYASDVVVMGEKVSTVEDYYMEREEFDRVVEPYRHGNPYGSNYLYMDLHVTTTPPDEARSGTDPWDPPLPPADEDGDGGGE